MRTLSILLVVILLSGCGLTYRSTTRPLERFDEDLAACGGSREAQTVVGPLLMMPLLVGGLIAVREAQKACMARHGWQVVEEPAPPDHLAPAILSR